MWPGVALEVALALVGTAVAAAEPGPRPSGLAPGNIATEPASPGADLPAPALAPAGVLSGGAVANATAVPRPRFSFAIGVGTSFDHSGTSDGRTVTIPAFLVALGAGDGALGFEASLMSTQASGRYRQVHNGKNDIGVDRAAVDLLLALRPALVLGYRLRAAGPTSEAAPGLAPVSYMRRIWHSFTLDVGGTAERVAPGSDSAYRLGYAFGAHLDIPLTPASLPTSLAIRLGARRVLAPKVDFTSTEVTDTRLDVFASVAAGF